MKTVSLTLAALVLAVFGSACTMQSLAPKGKVLLSAPFLGTKAPELTRGFASRGLGPKQHSPRLVSAVGSRQLSAATDINTITYSVVNLNTQVVEKTGVIDPYTLGANLILTPGETYRVIVDVDIKATAPGTKVGVTRYGDQADFTVDPNYDTYVDLTVHPSRALVFDPASVTGASAAKVAVLDPATTLSLVNMASIGSNSGLVSDPADKFFYSSDANLYYFNKATNAIYQWKDRGTKLSSTDIVLTGAAGGQGVDQAYAEDYQLLGACPDPLYPSTIWVVAQNTATSEFSYFVADVSTTVPDTYQSSVIDTDLDYIGTSTTMVPTGIAVDSTDRDVYITYYTTGTDGLDSGLLEFYDDAQWVPDSPSPLLHSSTSVFTDVIWDQGKVWVLTSPNTTLSDAPSASGDASILVFDDYLTPLGIFASQSYSGDDMDPTHSPTQLVVPNRFTGPIQGSTLYLSQWDFLGSGNAALTSVDLDTEAVTTY